MIDYERNRMKRKFQFLEMNNQIRELTTLVRTLTEHGNTSATDSERDNRTVAEENAPSAAAPTTLCGFSQMFSQL